jgi:hypothetical protein
MNKIYITLYDNIGLSHNNYSLQYNFFCDKKTMNNDSKLLKNCIETISKKNTVLLDTKTITKSIRMDIYKYQTCINITLQPEFGFEFYKIKINGISDTNINCIMLSSQIVNDLFSLIKKNNYKLESGNFIFKDKKLNINSTLQNSGFTSYIINEVTFEIEQSNIIENTKNKRKTIPKIVKTQTWDKYIGKNLGTAKCLCCKKNEIQQSNFHCGHIISVYNGGKNIIDNLKPICSQCNQSMGRQNMDEFMKEYGFE